MRPLLLAGALLVAAAACGPRVAPTPDPTLAALASQVANHGTYIAHLATQVGALAEAGTEGTAVPTPDAALSGSVVLEAGRCCVGAIAGSTVEIHAAFSASSAYAEITEMRVIARGAAARVEDFLDVAWEPFQTAGTFRTVAAINWVGFYVSVQFRDAQGHASPVFVDDISIEGSPPPPT